MKSKEVAGYQRQLDDVFTKVSAFQSDIELQSHWARYLCVLVSGFLETSVRAVLREYVKGKASPEVANYVHNRLKQVQNLKMQKILDLVGAFSAQWRDDLDTRVQGELATAVDSVVDLRNSISHGISVSVTYSRIRDYYMRVAKVVELLEERCNP